MIINNVNKNNVRSDYYDIVAKLVEKTKFDNSVTLIAQETERTQIKFQDATYKTSAVALWLYDEGGSYEIKSPHISNNRYRAGNNKRFTMSSNSADVIIKKALNCLKPVPLSDYMKSSKGFNFGGMISEAQKILYPLKQKVGNMGDHKLMELLVSSYRQGVVFTESKVRDLIASCDAGMREYDDMVEKIKGYDAVKLVMLADDKVLVKSISDEGLNTTTYNSVDSLPQNIQSSLALVRMTIPVTDCTTTIPFAGTRLDREDIAFGLFIPKDG